MRQQGLQGRVDTRINRKDLYRKQVLCKSDIKGEFGISLNSGIEVAVTDKVDVGARRLVLVLYRDLLSDLQAILEFFFELLDVDITRNSNSNQVILEEDLDFQRSAAGRCGHLCERALLSDHWRWVSVEVGVRRLRMLV